MPDAPVAADVSASPEKPDQLPTLLNSWGQVLKATRIVLATLRLAWVSVAATVAGGLLFLIPDQSQDVIRSLILIDLKNLQWEQAFHCLFFVVALVLWALSAQIWARIMTMHPRAASKYPREYNNEPETMTTVVDCVEAMPRLLGFSVFITIAMAIACIVLETPFFVYALVALPFLPLLLTLLIVLKRPQREKTLLLWTLAGVAAIALLVLLAYLSLWEKRHVETVVDLVVIAPLLILVTICMMLRMPARPETGALKLSIVFFLPMFLLLATAAEFSHVLKTGKICEYISSETSKAKECKDQLISRGLTEKPLLEFFMAKDREIEPAWIKGSIWPAFWGAIMPAFKLLGARLSMNWGGLLACGVLFVSGILWLLAIRKSLVDRWMGWDRGEWLKAAKSRNGDDEAYKPGSNAPIAPDPITSRKRYWILGALYISVAVVAYLTFLLFPVTVGQALGPAAVIALFLPFVIAPLALLSRLSLTWRFPVLASVLTVLAVLGIKFDQHYVRKIDDQPVTRTAWEKAFDQWYEAERERRCPPKGHCKKDTKLPIVIVATAGGGLRAAYWTATVLGELHDRSKGEFSKSLFAISGVSGGALGASVYRSLLTEEEQGRTLPECRTSTDSDTAHRLEPSLTRCAQKILSRDSLAPALGSMLFVDAVHRLLPVWPIFGWVAPDWSISKWLRSHDRAAALETSWEESWAHALPGNLLAGDFLSLWKDKQYPALLLNGTSVLSGRRIITSNLKLEEMQEGSEQHQKPGPFPDAVDFFEESGMSIRVSTAANNSARFPIIGPAGTFQVGKQQEQVVDGGYFENFGATTALDLVNAIRRHLRPKIQKDPKGHPGLRFIFVQISSDPTLPETYEETIASGQIGGDFVAPIFALKSTRMSRGTYQSGVVQNDMDPCRDTETFPRSYEHIRMDTDCGWGAPLGWTMSERIREKLNLKEDVCGFFTGKKLDEIIKAVRDPQPKVPEECKGKEFQALNISNGR